MRIWTEKNSILEFSGEYRFLSNFYPVHIEDKNPYGNETLPSLTYPSVEHAYQASKSPSLAHRLIIARLHTPGEAKRYGRKLPITESWKEQRVDVMEHLLRIKFAKGGELAQKLTDTWPKELVEGNTHGDSFWGMTREEYKSVLTGINMLGRLLMKLREELVMEQMTKETGSFAEWHKLLHQYAQSRGGSAADAEAWRDDYDEGKTPKQAYDDEWGEED